MCQLFNEKIVLLTGLCESKQNQVLKLFLIGREGSLCVGVWRSALVSQDHSLCCYRYSLSYIQLSGAQSSSPAFGLFDIPGLLVSGKTASIKNTFLFIYAVYCASVSLLILFIL